MLLIRIVASPEMLPMAKYANMMLSQPGRYHEGNDDARLAHGARQRYPKSLSGSRGQREAPDLGGVYCGNGLSREIRNSSPQQRPSAESPSDPSPAVPLRRS